MKRLKLHSEDRKNKFREKWLKNKVSYSLYFSIAFTLLGFLTSWLLFKSVPNFIGISTILFTVVMAVPLINRILEIEEKIEVTEKKSFLKEHELIIDFFIYFFLGVFIVMFVLSSMNPIWVFKKSDFYSKTESLPDVSPEYKGKKLLPPSVNAGSEIFVIFKNNFFVMFIAFGLSVIYGSGSLFLIVLNAAIFASALTDAIRIKLLASTSFLNSLGFVSCNFGIMLFHMLPEALAYLIAAIAGGVLSKAFINERFCSRNFFRVIKDAGIMLFFAFVILIISAAVEVKVSKRLFLADICSNSSYIVILVACFLIACIGLVEYLRRARNSKRTMYKN